jgi:hypothetical protein
MHVLHGEVRDAPVLAHRVHVHDARVGEPRDRFDLAAEALASVAEVELIRANQLEGDITPEGRLFGKVDDAHAAAADVPHEAELAEALGEARRRRTAGHRDEPSALQRRQGFTQLRRAARVALAELLDGAPALALDAFEALEEERLEFGVAGRFEHGRRLPAPASRGSPERVDVSRFNRSRPT